MVDLSHVVSDLMIRISDLERIARAHENLIHGLMERINKLEEKENSN